MNKLDKKFKENPFAIKYKFKMDRMKKDRKKSAKSKALST